MTNIMEKQFSQEDFPKRTFLKKTNFPKRTFLKKTNFSLVDVPKRIFLKKTKLSLADVPKRIFLKKMISQSRFFSRRPKSISKMKTTWKSCVKNVNWALTFLLSCCVQFETTRDARPRKYKRRVISPLQGAAFQTSASATYATAPSTASESYNSAASQAPSATASELEAMISNILRNFGLPLSIVLGVTSTLVAFLVTLIALIKLPKNKKEKEQKIKHEDEDNEESKYPKKWLIASLVLQAIAIASNAICMICGTVPTGFTEFVEERAGSIVSVFVDTPAANLVDLKKQIMERAPDIDSATASINIWKSNNPTSTCYFPEIVKSPFVTQPATVGDYLSQRDQNLFNQWCILNHPSVDFWTPIVLCRLWKFDDAMKRTFIKAWGSWCDARGPGPVPSTISVVEQPRRPNVINVPESDDEIDIVVPRPIMAQTKNDLEEVVEDGIDEEHMKDYEAFLDETYGRLHVGSASVSSSEQRFINEMIDSTTVPQVQEPIIPTMHFTSTARRVTSKVEPSTSQHESQSHPLQGAQHQAEMNLGRWIIGQIIGGVAAVCACIALQMDGKSVDFGTLMRNWQGMDFLTNKFEEVVTRIAEGAAGQTSSDVVQTQIQDHVRTLNMYIEIPPTTYAMQPDLRDQFVSKLREVESFLKLPIDPKLADKFVLSSLYNAANNFKTEIIRAAKDQTLRVEPRLFLFVGEGGVGKTKTMQNLASYFAKHLYPTLDPKRVALGVTPRDKYWPTFNGEKVWMVDEVAGSADFNNDLLMRDLRGLCSSARFGASTAEITGKDQSATPEIILGTTNTHPDTIMDRLMVLGGQESLEPCASRMHIFQCFRNVEKFGELNPANRDTQPYDRSGNMAHVYYARWIYSRKTGKYVLEKKHWTFKEVRQYVLSVRNNLVTQHQEMAHALQGAQTQFQASRQHFVVNMYGRPFGGKGKACDETIPDIARKTGYQVLYLHKEDLGKPMPAQTRRIILVLDDIIPCQAEMRKDVESWYMNLYNNALVPGSIIYITTNIVPTRRFPRFEIVPFEYCILGFRVPFFRLHAKAVKDLQVSEPGVLRRLGFTGTFKENVTHTTDFNLFVENDRYYQQKTSLNYVDISSQLFVATVCFIMSYWFWVGSLCGCVVLLFTWIIVTSTTLKTYTKSGLSTGIMLAYQSFLRSIRDVSVSFGTINVAEEPVISLQAYSYDSINLSAPTLVSNIFSEWNVFVAQNLPFKIFVSPTIAEHLLAQSKRLCVPYPDNSIEAVVDLMKTLRSILALANSNGTIYAKIGDIGEFYLRGDSITIDRRSASGMQYKIIPNQDHFTVCPIGEFDNAQNVNITWMVLAAYHISGSPLVDLANTHVETIDMVTRAILDPQILTNPQYLSARTTVMNQNMAAKAEATCLSFKNKLSLFFESTPGKVAIGVATALSAIVLVYGLYRLFRSDDTDDEDDDDSTKPSKGRSREQQRKRPSRPGKGKPRDPTPEDRKRRQNQPDAHDADEEYEEDTECAGQQRAQDPEDPRILDGNGRPTYRPTKQMMSMYRQQTKEQVKSMIPQSVEGLGNMNGYSAFGKFLSPLGDKAEKNECWVFAVNEKKDVLTFKTKEERNSWILSNGARNYGLFIEDKYLVTVSHLVEYANKFDKTMYVACDEMGTSCYKVEVVHDFNPKDYRDLIFLYVPHKEVKAFTSIRKNFHENSEDHGDYDPAVLKRYGSTRDAQQTKEYLYGSLTYNGDEVFSGEDADGKPYKMTHFGITWFSFSSFILTAPGDCGLPYYSHREGGSKLKIAGIHVMGNVRGCAIGVLSRIYQSDMFWIDDHKQKVNGKKLVDKQENNAKWDEECQWCEDGTIREEPPLLEKSQGFGHAIVWNNDHLASFTSAVREIQWKLEKDPHFVGKIQKNCGYSARGTVEHSHTHFVPSCFIRNQHKLDYTVWYNEVEEAYGNVPIFQTSFKAASVNMLGKILASFDWIDEFVLIGNRNYVSGKGGNVRTADGKFRYYFAFDLLATKHRKSEAEMKKMYPRPEKQFLIEPHKERVILEGEEMYVPKLLAMQLEDAVYTKEFADIPANHFAGNQTTAILGSIKRNCSPMPKPGYVPTPGQLLLESSCIKVPMRLDTENAPLDQLSKLQISCTGKLCPRTTQSVQWQGNHKSPPVNIVLYVRDEFQAAKKHMYSNLRDLSDAEVLRGLDGADIVGLNGLELKTAIGWSMNQMFVVQAKEDVIDLNERGVYSWKDTPAALFAKEWYRGAKDAVRKGIRPLTIYTELVKMEKLKVGKEFLGRIFCAADLMSVLVQRKFLGSFVAASTTLDPVIGVGSNPWHVFNEMAFALKKKGNYFTGDYKRWDKTVPKTIFKELGKILDNLNGTNKFSIMFRDVWSSLQVSGHTLQLVDRGMPSGAFVTANLNSFANDYALYSAWVILAIQHGKDPSFDAYNENVYRKFYGDDVIIGTTSEALEWYNLITVSKILSENFGFVLDSSEKKEGELKPAMDWEELSWCSRYLRKLDKFDFYVGALKKETITSMVHWMRKGTDETILAATLSVVIYEAASWEQDFFDQIVRDVHKICKISPQTGRYVEILTRQEYQRDMFDEGLLGRLKRHLDILLEHFDSSVQAGGFTLPKGELVLSKNSSQSVQEIRSKNCLKLTLRFYTNLLKTIKKCEEMGNSLPNFVLNEQMIDAAEVDSRDYVSALNVKAQAGEITMPEYVYAQQADLTWFCECTTRATGVCKPLITGVGFGQNKKVAKHNAAFQAFYQLFGVLPADKQLFDQWEKTLRAERIKACQQAMQGAKKQMNMSPGDAVPTVKSGGMDITVSGGTAVFSNTQIGNGVTDLNPVAFALNNIAQTGAPFDIKDSVYHIYQIEQMTSVAGTQGVGSEVFRLSLDPKTRPAIHANYINMHANHCPSVDFGVWINGTAGALGSLKIGYVTDISKASYSLEEIQQIASQDVTLSQPSTVSFLLRDIRQKSLYRKVIDDEEPYPGIVALVASQITNVQRNDSVSYPIQILSKLNPDYILATPLAIQNSQPSLTTVSLDSYFTLPNFDLVINQNEIPMGLTETWMWPECGYLTGIFKPTFGLDNLVGIGGRSRVASNIVFYYSSATVPTEPLGITTKLDSTVMLPEVLVFGYGSLPVEKRVAVRSTANVDPTIDDLAPNSSIYSIQPFTIVLNSITWQCSQVGVYPSGIILFFVVKTYRYIQALTVTDAQVFYVVDDYKKDVNATTMTHASAGIRFLASGVKTDYTNAILCLESQNLNFPGVNINHIEDADLLAVAPRDFTNAQDTAPIQAWVSQQSPTYLYTWLGTGNNLPTYSAPSGLCSLSFNRPGTSLNKGMPIAQVHAPGFDKLVTVLSRYQDSVKAEWLLLSFYSDAINAEFQLVFRNGVFLVRTGSTNLIRTSLTTSSCTLRDIKPLSNPQGVATISTGSWQSWLTSSAMKFRNVLATRFAVESVMNGASFQMAEAALIAAQAGGNMLLGGAQMGFAVWQQFQQQKILEQNRKFAMQMQQMKQESTLQQIEKSFQNSMALKGLSTASGNAGNLQRFVPATQGAEVPPPPPSSTISMPIENRITTQAQVHRSADSSAGATNPSGSSTELTGSQDLTIDDGTDVSLDDLSTASSSPRSSGASELPSFVPPPPIQPDMRATMNRDSYRLPITFVSDDESEMSGNDQTPLLSRNGRKGAAASIAPAQRAPLPGLNNISLMDVAPKITFPGGSRAYSQNNNTGPSVGETSV